MLERLVLVCGIPSEPPVRRVLEALAESGVHTLLFDQRRFSECSIRVEHGEHGIRGELCVGGDRFALEQICGVYTRIADWSLLPDMEGLPSDHPLVQKCEDLHQHLIAWYESSDALVVNKSAAMASNMSKPFQAQQILKAGFRVPHTLVTSRPERALEFVARHGRVIFKAASGERTVVTEFTSEHEAHLERLPACPVQFQEFVEGRDVRVHVVGDEIFATSIDSRATDYRYDRSQEGAALQPLFLDQRTADRCRHLARLLDLPLTGIDLRLTPEGEVYCFEANPSPAFSYYEAGTGQPIAAAIARLLAG